jgi:ubiquinone/menaquinone biosynthesis C-methylase UbiE
MPSFEPSVFCPTCRHRLPANAVTVIRCPQCNASYPVRDGIPLLGRFPDYYYDEIPLQEMECFLDKARTGTFAAPFESATGFRKADFLLGSHYDPTRASWKALMTVPMGGYDRVLDFGCGWGVNALGLAPHATEVVAMDLSWHRLLNLKLLSEALGRSNVTVVAGGDSEMLPFPDAFFDLIILTGVIEWIPVGGNENPLRRQQAFLMEIARVAKPSAEVFLSSENRFAYGYWAGRPDDHTGLLWGSLLPRRVANLYSRLKRRQPYENYTHSRQGYRRLLNHAGFDYTTFHGVTPAHRLFTKIFPLSRGLIVDPEESRGSAIKDILLRTRWATGLASAFAIRASKSPLPASYVERLCQHVVRRYPGIGPFEPEPYKLITQNFGVKAAVRGVGGAPGVLLRIALTPGKVSLQGNAVRAQNFWRAHSDVGPYLLPFTRELAFENTTVTVETLVSRARTPRLTNQETYDVVRTLLITLARNRGTWEVEPAWLNETAEFLEYLGAPHKEVVTKVAHAAIFRTHPTCYQHGDFRLGNFLMDPLGKHAIVDWEWAKPDGYPLADLLHFVANYETVGCSAATADVLERLLAGHYPDARIQNLVGAVLRAHDLEVKALGPCAVLYGYHTLHKHWLASDSYFVPSRFLTARQRGFLERLPGLAAKGL